MMSRFSKLQGFFKCEGFLVEEDQHEQTYGDD